MAFSTSEAKRIFSKILRPKKKPNLIGRLNYLSILFEKINYKTIVIGRDGQITSNQKKVQF